jgi:hypothetical protein
MKINVHVEDSYRSNPTININIERVHSGFGRKRHEQEIEGVEGTTNIHVQVKKIRK